MGGGYAYSAAESGRDPAPTAWDGMWWAVTTMTTVGYGDEYPVTTLGRVYALALMIVGISFVAILTGAIAERFLAAQIEKTQEEIRDEVETAEGDVLAELRAITQRLHELERRLGTRKS